MFKRTATPPPDESFARRARLLRGRGLSLSEEAVLLLAFRSMRPAPRLPKDAPITVRGTGRPANTHPPP